MPVVTGQTDQRNILNTFSQSDPEDDGHLGIYHIHSHVRHVVSLSINPFICTHTLSRLNTGTSPSLVHIRDVIGQSHCACSRVSISLAPHSYNVQLHWSDGIRHLRERWA